MSGTGTLGGTPTLEGALAVAGTFLVDAAGSTNDCVVGTGTIGLSQATLQIRDSSLMTADLYEMVNRPSLTGVPHMDVRGYSVRAESNRLVLLRRKLIIIIR